ncbi:hypothetical protein [Nocardioides sp.]|uniref:hypothetical protein n=1 Tax=Nocardioides sp. TaxID=35761 RepID=UPI0027336691|nr:hypothetical protein [Nocardioides sp.]MDP3894084.1 hypothetical protein [Nocardioides sp.]
MSDTQGWWREADGSSVTRHEAEQEWAAAAHVILRRVATSYHGLIRYGELGAQVQEATGVRTRVQFHHWIGSVLGLVLTECRRLGEPPFTALVVRKDNGMVGEGYDEVMRLAGLPPATTPEERENAAADARFECYVYAGAKLPKDGGRPALAPRLGERFARERRARKKERIPPICPQCFMALPASLVCDGCG